MMILRESHCQIIIKDVLIVVWVVVRESSEESLGFQQLIIIAIFAPMVRNLEETKCGIYSKTMVYYLLNSLPDEGFVCRCITSV